MRPTQPDCGVGGTCDPKNRPSCSGETMHLAAGPIFAGMGCVCTYAVLAAAPTVAARPPIAPVAYKGERGERPTVKFSGVLTHSRRSTTGAILVCMFVLLC